MIVFPDFQRQDLGLKAVKQQYFWGVLLVVQPFVSWKWAMASNELHKDPFKYRVLSFCCI